MIRRVVQMATTRRLVLSMFVLIGLFAACSRSTPPAGTNRPDIVFVLTDDQRWDTISIQGHSGPLKTPNIDRLGREGVYFRNAFATTALCSQRSRVAPAGVGEGAGGSWGGDS